MRNLHLFHGYIQFKHNNNTHTGIIKRVQLSGMYSYTVQTYVCNFTLSLKSKRIQIKTKRNQTKYIVQIGRD